MTTARRAVLGSVTSFAVALSLVLVAGGVLDHLRVADGSTGLDEWALRRVLDIRTASLTTASRVVTAFGGTFVITAVTILLTAALLATRQRRLAVYFVTVVVGAVALANLGKVWIGRPRPPVSVRAAHVTSSAFPSGHATQAAATFTAIAIIVFAVVKAPRFRSLLVAMLAILVIAVGLSRIALGVHWLTDVLGGWVAGVLWALGVAVSTQVLGPRSSRARAEATRMAASPRSREGGS